MKNLSMKSLSMLGLGMLLVTNTAMASQKMADLVCQGTIMNRSVSNLKGDIKLTKAKLRKSLVSALKIDSGTLTDDLAILKGGKVTEMKQHRNENDKLVSMDRIISTNKIAMNKSGNIEVKNHYTTIENYKRSIFRDNNKAADTYDTLSTYITIGKDVVKIKVGHTVTIKGESSFELFKNISCRMKKPLTKSQLDKIKSEAGLMKSPKKKTDRPRVAGHFFLLPS